jgi:predicted nicotinamide N-methyase
METSIVLYSRISYRNLKGDEISIENTTPGTFGLNHTANILWDGAYLLARLLERRYREELQAGCHALELGSGIAAIPSQVASSYGANVIATDMDEVIPSLEVNIHGNRSLHRGKVQVQALDWEKMTDETCPANIDIILCADLLYSGTHVLLVKVLVMLMKKNPKAKILMTNTDRVEVRKFRKREEMNAFNFKTIAIRDIVTELNLSCNQIAWEITLR